MSEQQKATVENIGNKVKQLPVDAAEKVLAFVEGVASVAKKQTTDKQ